MLLVTACAAGEPITSRPTAIPTDATSALHLSEAALCIPRVSVMLLATLELDVVAPVDAGQLKGTGGAG